MVSIAAFLTNLSFLAFVALAVPTSKLDALLSRRHVDGKSQPINRAMARSVVHSDTGFWAGAVWDSGDAQDTFRIVTGTFTAPTIYSSIEGAGLATWVGVVCPGADSILQVGIMSRIINGNVVHAPFYEWLPDIADNFNLVVNTGDELIASVFALSETYGRAIIENKTTGKTVWQDLTSSTPLCRQQADWIVEDYVSDGSVIPLAHFDPITFTDAAAYNLEGYKYTAAHITACDMVPGGTIRTATSVSADGSTVTVQELNDP